ncbi:unnamed protein product, partial [Porites evermanni]
MFNKVIVRGSLALRFNIDLTGSRANNFLVQNVARALVDKIAVKYKSANQPDASCHDIYKIFKTCVDAEKALDPVLGNNYNTRLDHPILSHCGVFHPEALYNDFEALYNDLIFELTLAVNPQRLSLKSSRLLFIEPYTAGTRDSEKYVNPNITIVSVTVNGSPNKIYNNGTEAQDLWPDV